MFRVGQKVVRVSSSSGDARGIAVAKKYNHSAPCLGEICTVRSINIWPFSTIITLVEHDNSHIQAALHLPYEPGFNARCFRPVVKGKTDTGMAILKKLLQPKPERVE